MKRLFASDYAAWCFLASFLIGIAAVLLGSPAIAAAAILLFYVSLDVLGWKWMMHWQWRFIVRVRTDHMGPGAHGWMILPPDEHGVYNLDFMHWTVNVDGENRNAAVTAYRLIQHGVMIPILAAAWHIFGWQAAVAPLLVWITFGADILYFIIGKETLPAIDNNTYFDYGYWSGPYGWGVWLASKASGTPTPGMVAGILYGQAVLGYLAAIWMLVG